MKNQKRGRKFDRKIDERNALLRHLAVSLIQREKIQTTEARAKELRPFIEKLVTSARSHDLKSVRSIVSKLGNNKIVAKKLQKDIAPRYEKRPGGYTRVVKLPRRSDDGASRAVIEFV